MEIKKAFSFFASTGLLAISCGLPSPVTEPTKVLPIPRPLSTPKAIEGLKYALPLIAEGQITSEDYFLKYAGAIVDIRRGGTIRVELDVEGLKEAHRAQLPLVLERETGPLTGPLKYKVTVVSSVYNEGALSEVNPFPKFEIEDPTKGSKDTCQIPGQVRHLSKYSVLSFWASFKNGKFSKTNGNCSPVALAERSNLCQTTSLKAEIDRNTTPQSIENARARLEVAKSPYDEAALSTINADVRGVSSLLFLNPQIEPQLQKHFLSSVFSARAGQVRDRINRAKLNGLPNEDPYAQDQIDCDMVRSTSIKGLII